MTSVGGASGAGGNATAGSGGVAAGAGGQAGQPSSDTPIAGWHYDDGQGPAYKDPGLPDDISASFDGPAATQNQPEILYPLDHSLAPKNLRPITVQWNASGKQLFRIEIAAPDGKTYRLFTQCALAQCQLQMPADEWLDLTTRFAGKDLTIAVSGTAGAHQELATSAPIQLSFSPEAAGGSVYYLNYMGTLMSATLESESGAPFVIPNSTANQYECLACHSVSRDGKVMAFAVAANGGENYAGIQVASVSSPTTRYVEPTKGSDGNPTDNLGGFVALNADGTLAAINGVEGDLFGIDFEIRNARTGATIEHFDSHTGSDLFGEFNLPLFPEWSPDGKHLAVTLARYGDINAANDHPCFWDNNTCAGSIAVLPMGIDGTITGPAQVVVAHEFSTTGLIHFYPTWSPDGQYLAFMSSTSESGSPGSFQNPGAVVRLVRAEGGPYTCPGDNCWELARGTRYDWAGRPPKGASVRGPTLPKFSPFSQGENQSLQFIAVNSGLSYGFLAQGSSQLWVFAVDTAKLGTGEDPSYAPVWLPFQTPDAAAFRAQWAASPE